jgi:hypothetical protein
MVTFLIHSSDESFAADEQNVCVFPTAGQIVTIKESASKASFVVEICLVAGIFSIISSAGIKN